MQGMIPGVVITKSSNNPGKAWSMDIRGESTISSTNGGTGITEPLYVIDGVVGGRLRDINPQDVQSIDVLKDVSSTAIYGSRGANGVVIVTTKKGSSGAAKVTLDSYIGQNTPGHVIKIQNAQQFYDETVTDFAANGGTPNTFTPNELNWLNTGHSTNWVKAITQNGLHTGSTVAVSGGSAGTTYHFSGGYIQDDGTTIFTHWKKYSLNAGIDSKVNNFLRVGFTAFINYETNPTGSLEAMRSAFRVRPTGVIYYSDLINPSASPYDLAAGPVMANNYSLWMGINANQAINPLVEVDPTNTVEQVTTKNMMGNAYAEFTLMKGLTFKSTINASNIDLQTPDYRGTLSKDRSGVNPGRATYTQNVVNNYTFDNQINYNYATGKHRLNVLVAQSAYKNVTQSYSIAVQNLPYSSLWYNLGTAGNANVTGVSSNYVQTTLESFMGRINYAYNDKYLLTLTARADGASQLAEGNKWATFPSAAVAWKIDQEKFIQKVPVISSMKLRVSYGQVGNANVAAYSTQATVLNTIYSYQQALGNGFAPQTLANADLKWERSQELNVGLDWGILHNRITGTIEVYNKVTKDLILNENLPTSLGFNSVVANVGQISNKGVELLLNTVNISNKDFRWTTSWNFAKNINNVDKLANGVTQIIGNSLFVGKPVKSYYDYKFNGIWQQGDSAAAAVYGVKPGAVKVVDKNGDGLISTSTGIDDRMVLGTQLPNYTMGMTNRFNYKEFDFSFLMYYRNGTMFQNSLITGTMADYTNQGYNHVIIPGGYWTKQNPVNTWYAPGVNQPGWKNAIAYQDASFMRVSDITLGYTVPQKKLDKWGGAIKRMRIYTQVQNPFVFTKYLAFDPEYNSGTYIDQVPSITYTFGISLSF
jgi:TonB-linked SusC/RagA family outer membrane protein